MARIVRCIAGVFPLVFLFLISCGDTARLLSPEEAARKSVTHAREIRGTVKARAQMGGVTYESAEIPYVARLKENQAHIPAAKVRQMGQSLKAAPGMSSSLFLAPTTPSFSVSAEAASVLYDTGALYASTEAPPSDLHLTAAQGMLIADGEGWTEDLAGDGSAIAQLSIQRATNSPNAYLTLTLNGEVMQTVAIDYQAASGGGWTRTTISGTGYHADGSYAASGTISEQGSVYYTALPDASRRHLALQAIARTWDGLPQLLIPLSPKVAFAARGCGYYMRRAWLYVGAMTVGAVMNNPLVFVYSGLRIANELHAYGRCKEQPEAQ